MPAMAKADPEALAAALRENLKRRKAQARTPEPAYGPDEEGDEPMPSDVPDPVKS
jgi:hypothetical protein